MQRYPFMACAALLSVVVSSAPLQAAQNAVHSVGFSITSLTPVILIQNNSSSKSIHNIQLGVQTPNISYEFDGLVTCQKGNKVKFVGSKAFFGTATTWNNESVVDWQTLYSQEISPAYGKKGSNTIEAAGDNTLFNIPVAKIGEGHPALRVDPLEELEKKRQTFIANGGSDLDFYRQTHQINLSRPLSMSGACTKQKWGQNHGNVKIAVKPASLIIKYIGDPTLTDAALIKPGLTPSKTPGYTHNLPYKLEQITFQPNLPHYYGKCVPNQDPKIRLNYTASGKQTGQFDFRIVSVSTTYNAPDIYYAKTNLNHNVSQSQNGYVDFDFPLRDLMNDPDLPHLSLINKTISHNMRLEARYKSQQNGQWSAYKTFDTAVIKHRCEPILNSVIRGPNPAEKLDDLATPLSTKRATISKPLTLQRQPAQIPSLTLTPKTDRMTQRDSRTPIKKIEPNPSPARQTIFKRRKMDE